MDLVLRITPSMFSSESKPLTRQSKRALSIAVCFVLVRVVNVIFQVSGFFELSNFLLLTFFFELLSCPNVKAYIRTLTSNDEQAAEDDDEISTPEEDLDGDCSKTVYGQEPPSKMATEEAEVSTDEGSDIEVTSSSEDDADIKIAKIESRPRWADLEDDDDDFAFDFTPVNTESSDADQSHSEATSDSEPEVTVRKPSAEPELPLYKRSGKTTQVSRKWENDDSDVVFWNRGASEVSSKLDYSAATCDSQPEVMVWKSRSSSWGEDSPTSSSWGNDSPTWANSTPKSLHASSWESAQSTKASKASAPWRKAKRAVDYAL